MEKQLINTLGKMSYSRVQEFVNILSEAVPDDEYTEDGLAVAFMIKAKLGDTDGFCTLYKEQIEGKEWGFHKVQSVYNESLRIVCLHGHMELLDYLLSPTFSKYDPSTNDNKLLVDTCLAERKEVLLKLIEDSRFCAETTKTGFKVIKWCHVHGVQSYKVFGSFVFHMSTNREHVVDMLISEVNKTHLEYNTSTLGNYWKTPYKYNDKVYKPVSRDCLFRDKVTLANSKLNDDTV